jgi:hypothetical protein
MIDIQREKVLSRLLYFGVPLVTIFLISGSVTDPVNAPKFFLLGAISFGAAGTLLPGVFPNWKKKDRILIASVSTFITAGIWSVLHSDSPFVQLLYGAYGRNNGFLTYLFLSFLCLSAATLNHPKSYARILIGLMIAGIVNLIYCGWVLVFGEVFSWNNPYGNILGTLGNPNFIGAFLGIFLSCWIAFLVSSNVNKFFVYSSILVIPVTLVEIIKSHAIQGRVLAVSGLFIVGFFWLLKARKNYPVLTIFSLGGFLIAALSLAGAFQHGPLTSIIYKVSVSLRGQYWLAGINTGNSHPWSGVGFDAFGDWYRGMRDIRAITLPGANVVVNASHNVFIDMFAFGGWPLFLSYVAIMGYTAFKIISFTKRMPSYDPIFVAMTACWINYQLQAIISINQIGLAIWGWVLAGLLIGYVNLCSSSGPISDVKTKARKLRSQEKVVGAGLLSGVGIIVGALLAVPPLSSDMKWRNAQLSLQAQTLQDSLSPGYLNPQNTTKYLISIQSFEQSGLSSIAHHYAVEAISFNPNSFDLWKQFYSLSTSTAEDKLNALKNMRRLDPLNPDVTK